MIECAGVTYPTLQAAANALGVSSGTIHQRIHSPRYPDYHRLSRPNYSGGPKKGAMPKKPRAPYCPKPLVHFGECQMGKPLVEPQAWPWDGDLRRRQQLVDPDDGRVIRRLGWLRCMRCSRPCFSEDVVRARLCFNCGGLASEPVGQKLTSEIDIRQRSPKPERPRPATTPHQRLF